MGFCFGKSIKLDVIREVSIVANPAYMGTAVNVRSIESSFEPSEYKQEVEELRNLIKI